MDSNENYKCRACKSKRVHKFDYNHWVFASKPTDWTNILCCDCGLISHYKDAGEMVTYADQSYRKGDATVFPPISLPWSTVSFNRWKHIAKIIEGSIKKSVLSGYAVLDFGGYNGLLVRALEQHWGADCTVADLDQEGLNFASAMGFKTINLSQQPELTQKYDLITMVHVLEHLEDPSDTISSLMNSLTSNGSIYVEVPNLFGFPMQDKAHLATFSLESLKALCTLHGLSILSSGYCKTPPEAIDFGYPFSTDKENIYMLARKTDHNIGSSVIENKLAGQVSEKQLKSELTANYGLRSFSMASAHFQLGASKVLFSFVLLIISMISLLPLVRHLTTSRSLHSVLRRFKNMLKGKS
jgi:2-polyprenyl-3-methyl-5-hydroxy-6-metoxy-1,4-benzoquinol methylase